MQSRSKTQSASITRMKTPLGDMLGAVDAAGALVRLDFHDGRGRPCDERELSAVLAGVGFECQVNAAAFAPIEAALAAYFEGDSGRLEGLAIAPRGTAFQLSVWEALRTIPRGKTTSYAGLASVLGRPFAARAVGAANGANVLALVIPCHRVVGADGKLTGYAGGLERKRALLELESVLPVG